MYHPVPCEVRRNQISFIISTCMLFCPKIVFRTFISTVYPIQFSVKNGWKWVLLLDITKEMYILVHIAALIYVIIYPVEVLLLSTCHPQTQLFASCSACFSKLIQLSKPEENYSCCCQDGSLLTQFFEIPVVKPNQLTVGGTPILVQTVFRYQFSKLQKLHSEISKT